MRHWARHLEHWPNARPVFAEIERLTELHQTPTPSRFREPYSVDKAKSLVVQMLENGLSLEPSAGKAPKNLATIGAVAWYWGWWLQDRPMPLITLGWLATQLGGIKNSKLWALRDQRRTLQRYLSRRVKEYLLSYSDKRLP